MIKVLLLSANPIDSPLNIDEEFRAIDLKVRGSEHRDHVDLVKHGAVRLDDVAGLLMRHKPHVVHFSGHGAASGISLTGADGKGRLVPPKALANIFRTLKENVRVVVLNACDSAPQAKAIVKEIDCAVGMSDKIDDDAAIAFAAAFYEALGYGQSVQAAFDLALVQLEGAGEDRSLAQLYKRRGVEPGDINVVNPEFEEPNGLGAIADTTDGPFSQFNSWTTGDWQLDQQLRRLIEYRPDGDHDSAQLIRLLRPLFQRAAFYPEPEGDWLSFAYVVMATRFVLQDAVNVVEDDQLRGIFREVVKVVARLETLAQKVIGPSVVLSRHAEEFIRDKRQFVERLCALTKMENAFSDPKRAKIIYDANRNRMRLLRQLDEKLHAAGLL